MGANICTQNTKDNVSLRIFFIFQVSSLFFLLGHQRLEKAVDTVSRFDAGKACKAADELVPGLQLPNPNRRPFVDLSI